MFDLFCFVKLGVMMLVLLFSVISLFVLVFVMLDCICLIFNESDKLISVMLCNNDLKFFYLV